MIEPAGLDVLALSLAFLTSVIATAIVRGVARRVGAIAAPKPDRWHTRPTAMFGGIAIVASSLATAAVILPHQRDTWIVLGSSTLLFAVGLIDDIMHIKPYQKLIGQVLVSAIPVYFGMTLPWTGSQLVNMTLTIFWLVGITNALNLLDNMDGLSAGIAAIAAIFLGINFFQNGQIHEAMLAGSFVAILAGFLLYNSNPASIFMGDCGSLFVGFFLASSALLSTGMGGRSRSILSVLAVPVLILVIPIFDTTLVTLLRRMSGRAVSQGGRDHASHRLVALGMSERRAVLMLYAFAILSGGLALLVRNQQLDVSIAAIVAFCIVLTLIGVYLAGVKVYSSPAEAKDHVLTSFLIDLSYKRRIFEVLLDVVLILLSYYLSYALLFGPMNDSLDWQLFARSAPLILSAKMAAFLVLGVYRGLWRYTSVDDFLVYTRAVMAASVGSVLMILFFFRFIGFSRTVFVIDGMILLLLVTMSRVTFRLFRAMLPVWRQSGTPILIYGAGDAGELLLRELGNNKDLHYLPVAFVDDDPRKRGRMLHGLRIYDPESEEFTTLCATQRIEEIVVSSAKVSSGRLEKLMDACGRKPIKRMRIDLVPVRVDELNSDDVPELEFPLGKPLKSVADE